MVATNHKTEPWRQRLMLPAYQVAEAARYAKISSQTVAAWHQAEKKMLSKKETREKLSYLQLIEVAVVAAFRKANIPLREIRAARDYVQRHLKSAHPFAEYKFKRYGKSLFTEYEAVGHRHLLKPIRQVNWLGMRSSGRFSRNLSTNMTA